MKGMKRVIGVFLAAAALTCLMAAPAFADVDANSATNYDETNGITQLCVTKDVSIAGVSELPDDEFTFTMTPDSTATGTINGYTVKPGIALETSSITKSASDLTVTSTTGASTLTASGTAYFTLPTSGLESLTAYRYTVSETGPSGYTNDSRIYTVDLYTDNSGKIVATVSYIGNDTAKQPVKFSNSKDLSTASLRITKTVDGVMSNAGDSFTFTLNIKANTVLGLTKGSTITVSSYSVDGDANSLTDANKTVTIGDDYTFTLKSGGYLTFDALPVGTEYTVKETDSGTYTTYVQSSLGGTLGEKLERSSVDHVLRAGGNIDNFYNTRDTTTITGVAMDYMPYIAVFAVAAAGVVAFVMKRRRNASELED